MKNFKNISIIFVVLFSVSFIWGNNEKIEVVASTSWTAAFAYLGGADNVKVIAPANLRHPPEYEITVSDIIEISNCDFFIYAGFERMMETLDQQLSQKIFTKGIKIKCDNSVNTILESAEKISKILGKENVSEERVCRYLNAIENGQQLVRDHGLTGAKVFCHKHQVFLAKELGFVVGAVFGPGTITSKDFLTIKNDDFDFIIDNIHNPVGKPLTEVSTKSKYIVWRNFPDNIENESLTNMVKKNIDTIFEN